MSGPCPQVTWPAAAWWGDDRGGGPRSDRELQTRSSAVQLPSAAPHKPSLFGDDQPLIDKVRANEMIGSN